MLSTPFHSLILVSTVFLAVSCTPERTILSDSSTTGGLSELKNKSSVYVDDVNGNKRIGDRGAEFESLMTKDGIPQTKMDKVSAFQGKNYDFGNDATGLGSKDASDYRKKIFDGSDKRFATRSWDGRKESDMFPVETPDFVKLQKPIDKTAWKNDKEAFAMNPSSFNGRQYNDRGTDFVKHGDGLIEEKINSSPEPTVIDWKEQQLRDLQESRALWKPLTPR